MSATQPRAAADQQQRTDTRRLKVIAESDPGALARILQPFQSLNVVPLRMQAARVGDSYLEVSVDVLAAEIGADVFAMIMAKLTQLPIVVAAAGCD